MIQTHNICKQNIMHEKWGHSYLGFVIKMMVKSNAIDFLQILGAVLNLPASQHSQSIPILLKESRIGFAD